MKTSFIRMQNISIIYLVIIFIGAMALPSDAKRGCALYGHSCYGGHGKRSELPVGIPPVDIEQQQQQQQMNMDKIYSADKFDFYSTLNENENSNDFKQIKEMNQDNGNEKHYTIPRKQIDYELYSLFRRWVENAKKSSMGSQQRLSENIFKNDVV